MKKASAEMSDDSVQEPAAFSGYGYTPEEIAVVIGQLRVLHEEVGREQEAIRFAFGRARYMLENYRDIQREKYDKTEKDRIRVIEHAANLAGRNAQQQEDALLIDAASETAWALGFNEGKRSAKRGARRGKH